VVLFMKRKIQLAFKGFVDIGMIEHQHTALVGKSEYAPLRSYLDIDVLNGSKACLSLISSNSEPRVDA
jgi:hypothetical protein